MRAARAFGGMAAAAIVIAVLLASGARAAAAAPPGWPASLTLATASPGGTYDAYGAGLARMLTRVLGVEVTARATAGPSENITLIEGGEAQLGFVTMGVAHEAWEGTGEWTHGTRHRAIRAIFPMYDTPFHFLVPPDSPARSLADVAGQRVGVGPEGGTAGIFVPRLLATLGIAATPVYGSWDELAARLRGRTIDALAAAGGVPFPAVAGLDAEGLVRSIAPAPEQILALRLAMPELSSSTIPAGTYPSLLQPYDTVGLYNFAVAREDLPADLVYKIVAAVFANHEEMMAAHPAAEATVPGNIVYDTFLPYHEGAIRYYDAGEVPGAPAGE